MECRNLRNPLSFTGSSRFPTRPSACATGQPAFLSHYPRSRFAGSLQLSVSGHFGKRAGFYAGLCVSTCIGLFLFTSILLPDAMVTFIIALALWALLRTLDEEERHPRAWAAVIAASLAVGLLTDRPLIPRETLENILAKYRVFSHEPGLDAYLDKHLKIG
jgi:hypothetical protein